MSADCHPPLPSAVPLPCPSDSKAAGSDAFQMPLTGIRNNSCGNPPFSSRHSNDTSPRLPPLTENQRKRPPSQDTSPRQAPGTCMPDQAPVLTSPQSLIHHKFS